MRLLLTLLLVAPMMGWAMEGNFELVRISTRQISATEWLGQNAQFCTKEACEADRRFMMEMRKGEKWRCLEKSREVIQQTPWR